MWNTVQGNIGVLHIVSNGIRTQLSFQASKLRDEIQGLRSLSFESIQHEGTELVLLEYFGLGLHRGLSNLRLQRPWAPDPAATEDL